MNEVADTLGAIRERAMLPIIVDIDTGFGNALNVQRTVREFERRGASALQMEDQVTPKRCGHLRDKALIPAGEMAQKIKAALDARHSDDMLIIARTDAIAVEGFDAALDRAENYIEAGADLLFVEALQNGTQMTAVTKRFGPRVPVMANMVEGGKTPHPAGGEAWRAWLQAGDLPWRHGSGPRLHAAGLLRAAACDRHHRLLPLAYARLRRAQHAARHRQFSLTGPALRPGNIMIDSVTLAVLKGRLEQIADEMDATLFRSAFNPIIAEAHDASHGLYDARTGDTLVQGKSGLPIFVGVMAFAVKATIDKAARDGDLGDGDIYLFNDPYDGGTHLSDFKLVRPYFRDGQVFCWLASVGHWHDVGGNVPGNYNPVATESYQEGMLHPAGEARRARQTQQRYRRYSQSQFAPAAAASTAISTASSTRSTLAPGGWASCWMSTVRRDRGDGAGRAQGAREPAHARQYRRAARRARIRPRTSSTMTASSMRRSRSPST